MATYKLERVISETRNKKGAQITYRVGGKNSPIKTKHVRVEGERYRDENGNIYKK